ncbi:hypothetical protein DRO48_03440, partial [Candidatus Bathyarchaeota archaeon]
YPRTEVVNGTVVQSPSTVTGAVTITLAVWGVGPDEPVEIRLDGKVIKRIVRPGYYVVSEKVTGTHHIAVLCRYKVFEEAVFYAVPPPPPPPTIPLAEFMRRLKEQREAIISRMSLAAAAGVPLGIYTKRKTKIRTDWVFPLPGALLLVGYQYMPDLYWLIPLAISYALAYALCRDYADLLGVMRMTRHGTKVDVLRLDDEGNMIEDISPRYWRSGFVLKKKVRIIDSYPILFQFRGEVIKCVLAKEVRETERQITIICHYALAKALVESKVIETLNERLARAEFRSIFYMRALESKLTEILHAIEKITAATKLDEIMSISEAPEKIEEAVRQVEAWLKAKKPRIEGGLEGTEVAEEEGSSG